MALLDFVKDAGEKIFGLFTGSNEENNRRAGEQLTRAISELGFDVKNLAVNFKDGFASVSGTASTQGEKEKILLAIGNTRGVASVDDHLQVEKSEPEATFYTVQKGDTLSGIAKKFYGDAGKYTVIFEANRPLLKDPNLIYPGQALRIPPLH